ncbi:MAG: glycine zipper 2TM domain-containing protein [Betaproteobacteria bacterium]|nr:glycine zipper 2TM domain-containing protein [Betaproteobacteria bacterium]
MKTLTKIVLSSAVLATLTGAGAVFAAQQDVATVVSATPIYTRVATPRRECWTEQVSAYEEQRVRRPGYSEVQYESRESSGGGALLGAIVGGAIGRQFGNSSGGKDRGTAAGAIIGGLIGNDIERGSNRDGHYRTSRDVYDVQRVPVTRDVQRCQTVQDTREEISGYDVVYRFNGKEYTTRMSYDPGPTLPIEVNVRPRGEGRGHGYREPVPTYRRF